MKYVIAHELHLAFAAPVWEHHCEVRLTPQRSAYQTVRDTGLEVEPTAEVRRYADCYGNSVHHFEVLAPHDRLTVRGSTVVDTTLTNPFDYAPVPLARERAWIDESLRAQPRLRDYLLHRSACTPAVTHLTVADLQWPERDPAQPLLDALMAALEWVAETIDCSEGFRSEPAPLAEALAARTGGCQDLAHLLVSLARSWSLPARYVMGYRDPGYAEDAEQSQNLHAWAEVLVPGAGWRGIDPSARLLANDTYVAVASGRDAADALPLRSTYKGGAPEQTTDVVLEVTRDQ